MGEEEARRAVDDAVRSSYGRLMAFLTARSRDVAAAEDALSEAFRNALEAWPRVGIPEKPEAWLLTAARRRLVDESRRARVYDEAAPTLLAVADQAQQLAQTELGLPDERLKLLFVCAHPAIDAAARTPLMLQVVLGLDAARIASAFLVQPAAMGQRLTRAKTKIRDARIPFDVPEPTEMPARLGSVLEAIYAAFGSGWDDVAGFDPRRTGLVEEAIHLGRLLSVLMPGEPEVLGLLALMLYCQSRKEARRDALARYVPLSEQDASRWSGALLREAEQCLTDAARGNRVGRFQLEAAIQSAHVQRAVTGETDWEAIATLYEGLLDLAPTTGAFVGRAAAVAEARGADTGWALLRTIPAERARNYQPYWAVAAHLLKRMNRIPEAINAYQLAIGLCEDPPTREFLQSEIPGQRTFVSPSSLKR